MKKRPKAQMWFTDFIIGTFIFSFMLIAYYTYTTNISKQDYLTADVLISDAEAISSSLLTAGFPDNWNSATVQSIGITNNNQKINSTKFNELMEIEYSKSKKLFGTTYDYVLFFVNGSDDVQNVWGFCGTGHPDVEFTQEIDAAYYYQNSEGEQFLKTFMETTFDATSYCDGGPKCDDLPFSDLLLDINNYDFIVVESPKWNTDNFNDFVDGVDSPPENTWLRDGGILFVGGALPSANQFQAFGVEFNKISGASDKYGLATVVNEDTFISVQEGENMIFTNEYHVEDISSNNFIDIARFNGTDAEFEDIKANGNIAIARWLVGTNGGKILFFSDFDADYLAGDFQEILEGSAKKWANAKCLPIIVSNINKQNLVKIERLLIYDSKPIKMVLYLWQ